MIRLKLSLFTDETNFSLTFAQLPVIHILQAALTIPIPEADKLLFRVNHPEVYFKIFNESEAENKSAKEAISTKIKRILSELEPVMDSHRVIIEAEVNDDKPDFSSAIIRRTESSILDSHVDEFKDFVDFPFHY